MRRRHMLYEKHANRGACSGAAVAGSRLGAAANPL